MRSLGAKILEVSGLAKFSEPELISPKEYDSSNAMTCPYCGNQVKNAMNLENDEKSCQELVDLLIEDWNKRAEKSPYVSELMPK